MRFKDIVGLQHLKEVIVAQIERGRIPHAQIIEGVAGYQSLPFAIAYAQYINCLSPIEGDSCGECSSCIKSEMLQHPDISFVFPAGVPLGKKGKKDDYISIDLMAEWRKAICDSAPMGCFTEAEWYSISGIGGEKGNSQGSIGRAEAEYISQLVSYKPIEDGYRVIIIWLPEKMNSSAANALLKLFEEPAPRNIFLFVSEQPQQILETITSRTQRITIPAIDNEDIVNYLVSISDRERGELEAIGAAANGNIIDAVKSINSSGQLENLERFKLLMQKSYKPDIHGVLEWVDEFIALNKEQQKAFFNEAINILRQSFMLNIGLEECAYSFGEYREFVDRFQAVITKANIADIVASFERAYRDISHNGNSRVVITHFALTLTPLLRKK